MKFFSRLVLVGFLVGSLLFVPVASARTPLKTAPVELAEEVIEDGGITAKGLVKVGVEFVVRSAAMPVAVSTASAAGVTAGTGTAISTLSGAAAVSATSAAVGAPVASALSAIGITVAAPAVIGGVIIAGAGIAAGLAINAIFFDD